MRSINRQMTFLQLSMATCFSMVMSYCSTFEKALHDPPLSKVSSVACGQAVGNIDGVAAYSNGAYTGTGNSCAGQGGKHGYLYQCKELVSRYFTVKYQSPRVACHAGDCLEAFAKYKDHFRTFANGDVIPQRGDAVVFKGYTWGHIAIVTKVTASEVEFLQQNTAQALGKVTRNAKGQMGEYLGFKPHGIIRHLRAPIVAEDQLTAGIGSDDQPKLSALSKGGNAQQICASFGANSQVNTCLRSVKGFSNAGDLLVNCKTKTFETCAGSCQQNSLGKDDYCKAASQGKTVNFTAISPARVAEHESEVQKTRVSAEWVTNDLKLFCQKRLLVNGAPVNTCRGNFALGSYNGRFDSAKGARADESALWLIDCQSSATPQWVACHTRCVHAAFGKQDYCQ
jgi:hypothetical protein